MSSAGGLTPGDPLGGDDEARRRLEEEQRPLWSGPRPPEAGARPAPASGGWTPPAGGGWVPPAAASSRPGLPARPSVLSGWWRRVGAAVIDGFIVTIIAGLILAAVGVGLFDADEEGAVGAIIGFLLTVLALGVASLLYAPLLMARTNGQTLGRMATGIRVIRTSGAPVTFSFAMLREVAVKTLLFGVAGSLTFGLANVLDVLWPLWDEEKRALHDFLVQTRTVRS